MKPTIAITLGDPAGIGPEIVSKALRHPLVRKACHPVVLGTAGGLPMGRPTREAGQSALAALRVGLYLALARQVSALVTAPVSKESFHLAGHGLPGHTEWLARESRARASAMLMVAGSMRALLLTRHVPLSKVSSMLNATLIQSSAILAYDFLKRVAKIKHPRVVACGINPHAGDHGLIGRDEERVYAPALRALKKKKISVLGPVPADTVFSRMAHGQFDLALAAYHDQGMIPLKLHAPDKLVNITLGLPFIRTSPGHGTAYDIAGRGQADPRPMIEAILLAARYARA